MLGDGPLGYSEDFGDFGKTPAVDTVEEKDVPGTCRQRGQGIIDTANSLARADNIVRRRGTDSILLWQEAVEKIGTPFLRPDMVDRGVARAA